MKPGTRRLRAILAKRSSTYALGAVLLLATNALNLSFPWLLKIAFDGLQAGRGAGFVLRIALVMAAVAVVRAFIRTWSRFAFLGGSREIVTELRETVFAHLQRLPVSAFDRRPTGEIVSRLINDLQHVRNLFGWVALNVANTALLYVVALSLLLRLDPTLTAIALVPYIAAAAFMKRYGKRLHEESTAAQAALARISSRLSEVLNGIVVIKAHRREAAEIAHFDGLSQEYWEASRRFARTRALVVPIMGSVASFGAVAVLALGGIRVMDGSFTLGDFVAFNATLAMMSWPSIALGWILNAWQRGTAAMDRIEELLSEPGEEGGTLDAPPFAAEPMMGEIEARGLTFTHEGADAPALKDVWFLAPAGTRLGVVGRTGSGKTTLAEIISGLRRPERGQVYLDGADLCDVPLSRLRARIALVPQGAFVFSATVRENVAYGLPPGSENAPSVDEAVRESALEKDLPQLPQGLMTVVGERGVTLSGGQRQRVTIARALAREHDLLLLDDSLSAVDPDTEREILTRLEERRRAATRRPTEVIIAHRLSAVSECERIIVLDHGSVAERGTHAELLAQGGLYAALWREQELERAVEAAE